jgi:hypothetical protein
VTGDKRKPWLALVSFAALVLLLLLIDAWMKLHHHAMRPNSAAADAEIVERSFALLAARQGVDVASVKRIAYARVIDLPGKRCVQVSPTLSTLGLSYVFCFSEAGTRLIEEYRM